MSTKSSKSLAERIKAALKLGEDGKIMSFFDRQLSKLRREIKQYQRNIQTEEFESENVIADLTGQLEDAKESVVSAYENLEIDSINTNSAQENYEITYWGRIQKAESVVKNLVEQIEKEKESLAKRIERINEEIEVRNKRIAIIEGTELPY